MMEELEKQLAWVMIGDVDSYLALMMEFESWLALVEKVEYLTLTLKDESQSAPMVVVVVESQTTLMVE